MCIFPPISLASHPFFLATFLLPPPVLFPAPFLPDSHTPFLPQSTSSPGLFRNIQWNLDLTKGQRTGKMCSLHRSFVIWRFFFVYRISSNDSRPWINSLLPIIASARIAYRLAVYDICRLQTADC